MFLENIFVPVYPYPADPYFQVYPFQMKGPPAKKKVLIVDDDIEIAELLKTALDQEHKFDIRIASDPYEAINLMLEDIYDFVLLDWNLPKMNGLKTIQEAEKIFRYDPTLPLDWESRKVGVVTISGDPDKNCRIPTSQHFKYIGHISKQNKLPNIVGAVQRYFDGPFYLAG